MSEDVQINQIYWQAGYLAKEFNVTKTTLTDWCRYFGIKVKKRSQTRRYFTEEHVALLRKIATLHATGYYTLKGIKHELSLS